MEWRRKTEDGAQRERQKWVAMGVEIAMASVKSCVTWRIIVTGSLRPEILPTTTFTPLYFSGAIRFTLFLIFCVFNALTLFDCYSYYN